MTNCYDAPIKPCQRWWWVAIDSCAINSVCEVPRETPAILLPLFVKIK